MIYIACNKIVKNRIVFRLMNNDMGTLMLPYLHIVR